MASFETNGGEADGVIQVVCPGPITHAETGHPVSGQYLEAVTTPATSADSGSTGTAAISIDAFILTSTGAGSAPAVVFNSFFVEEPLPTSLELPCSGSGGVAFVPEPTSPTARTAAVAVTFENIVL